MRYIRVFAVLIVLVAVTKAEVCPNNNVRDECQNMNCASGYHRECVNGICTCNPNQAVSCLSQQDCLNSTSLPDCWRTWHCVDNRCRCGGNFG